MAHTYYGDDDESLFLIAPLDPWWGDSGRCKTQIKNGRSSIEKY